MSADFYSARRQLELLKIQHEQLSRHFFPNHPKMVRLDEEISQCEKLIAFSRDQTQEQQATAKQAARQALKLRIDSLQDAIKELEALGVAVRPIAANLGWQDVNFRAQNGQAVDKSLRVKRSGRRRMPARRDTRRRKPPPSL
jgi:hypothetical protein